MLRDTPCNRERTLEVDGAWVHFSLTSEGTKVSLHALHAFLGFITSSWETMVTSLTPDSFAVRGTSFLTSDPSFQRQTSLQGRKQ